MRGLSALIFCAALPVTAGFAFSAPGSAWAQGMQYNAPAGTTVLGTNSTNMVTAVPTDMTREAALERQVRDLTNQLEQRDFQLRQLQQSFDKYSADTNQRLQALEGQLSGTITGAQPSQPVPMQNNMPVDDMTSPNTPPAPTPIAAPPIPSSAGAQDQSGPVSGSLVDPNGAFQPKSTPQLGQITETTNTKPDGIVTSGKPQGGTPSAAQAYDQAFADLQSGNAGSAETAFSSFLTTYPTHPLAANAQYWLGESYFSQSKFPAAAKTFAKAFQEHPQGQKAPDALLKLGLTLEKMNKKDDACLTLGELAKRFPSGPASVLRRGNEEAVRMGCKTH